jgi:L-malate glycosyltransferase
MRVLIFSTAYLPLIGGAEIAVKEITDRIKDVEFDMVTARLSRSLPREEKIGNINVHRVGIGVPFFDKILLALFGYKKGLELHKNKKYNVVWSIMASYNGFSALKFKQKTGVKFLLTLQEGDSFDYILGKVKLVKKRFKQIFIQADALQAISNYLLKWGRDMGFKGLITEVIPNGVDISNFAQSYNEKDIKDTISSFNFIDKPIILVTASRLVEKNGIEDVINALPLLPSNVCFVICGDGGLRDDLKNLTVKLEVDKRVLFLGNKNHRELNKIFKASDIFIRPSLSEGLGNSFLEAMSAGLPTIATEVGGIPDFLVDNNTGWFCEVKNPASIAEKVKYIIDDTDRAEISKVIDNAKEMVTKNYSWETIVNKMNIVFKELNNL